MPTPMKSANESNAKTAAAPEPKHGDPIGRAETVAGEATASHADGTKATLSQGALIYQGDVIQTGSDGKVSILFADSSTFALGSDGEMVMDELVYDPKSHQGHSLATVAKGVFVFVSGEIAAHNPDAMEVRTPVMVIGVRGTKVAGEAHPAGQENKVALLPEDDGSVGSIVVTNDAGSVVLDTANQMTRILFGNIAPSVPEIVTQAVINQLFGNTLSFLPILSEIGAATGLFDAIGGLLGGSSDDHKDGSSTGNSEQKNEDSGGFFDSILPKAGGSTNHKGDGSWLEPPTHPHEPSLALHGPGYSLFGHEADAGSAGHGLHGFELPSPPSLA